ncbi:uncharacterized protein [Venturia canescens]|uniref:uncharacterized protein n=1 Tax=Venturia canescens TaxID=32260 RepID=UPI001C9CBAD6|nr:uncharacterized protein LOC122408718 [Venturia canescens]
MDREDESDANDLNPSDDSDFEPISESSRFVNNTAKTQDKFCVGKKFNSFEDLEQSIEQYQKEINTFFYVRDSITIPQARKKRIKRCINEKLKYYFIKYCCIHGGKNFVSQATGVRSSSTFQKKCTSYIRVGLSACGNNLIVTAMNNVHTHKCSKELFVHLPRARSLSKEERKQVAKLLDVDANKKKVSELIQVQTGKKVLLKDLHNVNSASREDDNNLQETIAMLQEKYHAQCYVYEEANTFKGLFFVTPNMKRSMEAFPEFVGIDGTFKLLNIRAPIYLMVVEDSEGSTEIVGVCILMSEDADSIRWMIQSFKKAHPSWSKIKCVMADKDLLERKIIKEEIPFANVLICVFHALRTFHREITCDKLGITSGQRDTAKEIIQKMVYARSEEQYQQLYQELNKLPNSIVDYFNSNWHEIRHEWSMSNNFMQSNFLNITNNRLESLNAKVKSVVKRYTTLEDFVRSFFILVMCLNDERDHKAAYTYQKIAVQAFDAESPEYFFSHLLTKYAFRFVEKELHPENRTDFTMVEGNDGFLTRIDGTTIHTNSELCDCLFFVSMKLPCRHIFEARKNLGLSLCVVELCDERWTRKYFFEKQRVFNPSDGNIDVPSPTVTQNILRRRVLSQSDRYRKAFLLAKESASLISESTGDEYIRRMQQMTDMNAAWSQNTNYEIPSSDSVEYVVTNTPLVSESQHYSEPDSESAMSHSINVESEKHEITKNNYFEELDLFSPVNNFISNLDDSDNLSSSSLHYSSDDDAALDIVLSSPADNVNELIGDFNNNAVANLSAVVCAPNEREAMNNENLCSNQRTTEGSRNLVQQKSAGGIIPITSNSKKTVSEFSSIIMPPVIKRRGRPKGSEKTVIGLTRKRKSQKGNSNLPFKKKRESEKMKTILYWLADASLAKSALYEGRMIEKEEVETRPEKLSHALIDDEVNVAIVEKYFTNEAWQLIKKAIDSKKKQNVYHCGKCSVNLDDTVDSVDSSVDGSIIDKKTSIGCDYCLIWYHLSCVSLKKKPKTKFWKCPKC